MFCPASSILYIIIAPITITAGMYQISDTDFEQTLKAYENHKMQPSIYKAVVYFWSFLSLGINDLFFINSLATHNKLLGMKLELKITLPLGLSKEPFFLNFWCYFYVSHPPLYATFSVHPSVHPSIAHHISGTINHLIIIFGAHS